MTALRPVYIDRGAAAVRLDGPALVVDEPGRAEGRFPLRLLSRIVVRGAVPWSMEALFACLGAGIPVTFLSLDGDVVGLCLGRDRPEESLAMLLDRLTGEPGWAEIYGRWRRAAERQAIVEVARRFGLLPADRGEGADLRADCVRARLFTKLPGGDTPGARSTLKRLDGCLAAHLSELFARAGVPLAYRGGRGSPLDLRPAFRAALRWYLWAPLGRWCELQERHPAAERAQARRRVAAQYEAAAPQIAARFRRFLGSLDRLLREELP
jgi:CRISPR associated protein Cas1